MPELSKVIAETSPTVLNNCYSTSVSSLWVFSTLVTNKYLSVLPPKWGDLGDKILTDDFMAYFVFNEKEYYEHLKYLNIIFGKKIDVSFYPENDYFDVLDIATRGLEKYNKAWGHFYCLGLYEKKDIYWEKIKEVDRVIAKWLNEIDKDYQIILTADHGCSLGENNEWGHSIYLNEYCTHVPVIIWNDKNNLNENKLYSLKDIFYGMFDKMFSRMFDEIEHSEELIVETRFTGQKGYKQRRIKSV